MERVGLRDGPVVVTGGAGFLGREVVRQLQAEKHDDIRVLDMVAADDITDVSRHLVDLRNGDLDEPLRGAKTVLHLAACQYHSPHAASTYDLPFDRVNVDATRRLVDAARRAKVERFVFVSTNMVYGLPQKLPVDETHQCKPFGPYGRSKLAAEALLDDASEIDPVIVRPGLIVGPGRRGVLARVFDMLLHHRPILLLGNGKNRYELMASEDVASLVVSLAQHRGSGAFNAGSKSVPTMREWIEAAARRAKSLSPIIGMPGSLAKPALALLERVRLAPLRRDQYLIADIDYFLDWTKAARELGWAPKWTGLDAALATYEWYVAEGRRRS